MASLRKSSNSKERKPSNNQVSKTLSVGRLQIPLMIIIIIPLFSTLFSQTILLVILIIKLGFPRSSLFSVVRAWRMRNLQSISYFSAFHRLYAAHLFAQLGSSNLCYLKRCNCFVCFFLSNFSSENDKPSLYIYYFLFKFYQFLSTVSFFAMKTMRMMWMK